MKLNLTKNWVAKILSLLLALVIWYLIKENLKSNGGYIDPPPKGVVIPEL